MSAAPAIDYASPFVAQEISRAYRLQQMGLTVDGQPFSLRQYPYLRELFDKRARHKTIIKGAQMGFTVTFVLDAIMSARVDRTPNGKPLRGIGYFFPTERDVLDFSRARFGPMLRDNAAFVQYADSTDSAGLKTIANVPVYFRAGGAIGASTKQSLSGVKSIACDRTYKDEVDEMQAIRVEAINKRLDGSKCPEDVELSTPTVPGYGVDYEYQLSDGRAYFWRCDRCNEWTCLERTWPDCIAEPSGAEPYYLCCKCREPLERKGGEWVPARPHLSATHLGYWASQLCSPTKTAADIIAANIRADRTGRKREFYNQVLARAHAEVEDQLTKERIDDCLTEEPRSRSAEGPTCAGADPGVGKLHYYVKERIGDRDSRTLTYGDCGSLEELAQISRKFNVQTGIIDEMAETNSVRKFVEDHREWWCGRYVSHRKGSTDWDPKTRTVTMGRNEVLDASHAKFVEKREQLPAPDESYHDLLVPQLCNMARIRKEDEVTGEISYRWVILGGVKNDHLKHCHAYATVAEERVGLAKSVARARTSQVPNNSGPRSFMAS